MSYILVIGIFESLFLIMLLLAKKIKARADYFLGVILLLYAASIGTTFIQLYNAGNNYPYPFFLNIAWLLLFLHGPALWAYIKSLSVPAFRLKTIHLLHLLPFLFFVLLHYYDFMHLPYDKKILIIQQELFKDKIIYKFTVLAVGISTLSYNIWALLLIRRYHHGLRQIFSRTENKELNWLRLLIIASISVYAFNVGLYIFDLIFNFAPYRILTIITYSFATVYVLVLGWLGIQQPNIFLSTAESEKKIIKLLPVKSEKTEKKVDHAFISKLSQYMENMQPYLEPEITIAKLAHKLEVKPEYLSEILNSKLNQSFFEFINKYRINEFKVQSLAGSNAHLSIMGVAYNCGFNSKASFYRAFKKFEGISPTAYIEMVSEK